MQNSNSITIKNIDEYVELLYEEIGERVRASSVILQLARNPKNLEELEKNEACLSALSRILREDWRKSLDLATNIIYIFFCFSTYTKFHSVIVQYKIGSLCMEIIDYELRRYRSMRNELDSRRDTNQSAFNPNPIYKERSSSVVKDGFLDIWNEEKPKEMEPPRRRIPELQVRLKSSNLMTSLNSLSTHGRLQSSSSNNLYESSLSHTGDSDADDLNIENGSAQYKQGRDTEKEIHRLAKQLKVFAKKQDQLLRVAFYLLLNMAENIKIEEKMGRKFIVRMLVMALERQNIDLLLLVTTFLKKLSIVGDNKNQMYELNIIEKLTRLFESGQQDLVKVTLKLIFNLSFDGPMRQKMVAENYLPKLVMFLNDENHHGIAVKILYHLSLDDKVKSMYTPTECIHMAIDAIILNVYNSVDFDLIALCINLSLSRHNAEIMVDGNRLSSLMARAFKYQDTLIMKLLRNLSQHEVIQPQFVRYVDDLAGTLTTCENEAFVVECIGMLGNLTISGINNSDILNKYQLINWIRQVLKPNTRSDDLVLDTIIYLGTCAYDELCALLLCRADIVVSLIELLKAKQEDDEIVLQIIFIFQQLLRHETTREYIVKDTESPAYLIDLMQDKNEEIRKVCDYCLDIIAMSGTEWTRRIKLEQFRNHNSQWLCVVESMREFDTEKNYGNGDNEEKDIDSYMCSSDHFGNDNFLRTKYEEHDTEIISAEE